MKVRSGYISNSSSSSFVLKDWSSVPEDVRSRILNPKEYVLEVWREKGLPLGDDGNYIDREKALEMGFSENDILKYDFGWLSDIEGWEITEGNDDTLNGFTIVDNFVYPVWLRYLNVEFEAEGENWDFISDNL